MKLVCTLGPASAGEDVVAELIRAGTDVFRINFSHGDAEDHAALIDLVRAVAAAEGTEPAVMADLPGPKIRIGKLVQEPLEVNAGDDLTLTTQEILGDARRVSGTSFWPSTSDPRRW